MMMMMKVEEEEDLVEEVDTQEWEEEEGWEIDAGEWEETHTANLEIDLEIKETINMEIMKEEEVDYMVTPETEIMEVDI